MVFYKGNIVHTPELGQLEIFENGYLAVNENGTVAGIFNCLPDGDTSKVVDYTGKLIIPSFVDLHIHSSQYPNRGLGYDIDFLEWLEKYTYPCEKKYADIEYSSKVNAKLIKDLWKYGIMHSSHMSSTDYGATLNLINMFKKSGMVAYIGKMNSDMAIAGDPVETTECSIKGTLDLIAQTNGHEKVTYAVCPEFIPCCSSELMTALGNMALEHNIPVHSHYAEGPVDLNIVAERYPDVRDYGTVYENFNLFGQTKTIMAHSIFTSDEEVALMAKNEVVVAHCCNAIFNIPAGKFMPLRKYLDAGVHVGLGSDIAGGNTLDPLSGMIGAIRTSKLVFEQDPTAKPITFAEGLYLATKGGGFAFGNVGSFENGYEFSALVIDDDSLDDFNERSVAERIERFIYTGTPENIIHRYCRGEEIFEPQL